MNAPSLAALSLAALALAGLSAHAQPATRTPAERTRAVAARTHAHAPSPRHLAAQRAGSVDAGDSFAAPDGRRHLRRMTGVVSVELGRDRDSALRALTGRDGALAGYTEERRLRSGVTLLSAPSGKGPRDRAQPGIPIETLRQSLRTRDGAHANPVFIDPKTGLRLIATRRLIVRLQPGIDARDHFGAQWMDVRPLWGTTDQFVLSLPGATAEDVFAEVDRQSARPGVEWAEPDFICQVVRAAVPNDSLFGSQWHLENTGQHGGTPGADAHLTGAWDVTTGNTNTVIAIIDDGVQLAHPDLGPNIFRNTGETPGNGFDDDNNGIVDDYQGYDFVADLDDANPYSPDDNHGTAVAGVAAAAGNNGIGTAGAAYGCRILPIKVLEGEYSASTSAFARALRYAAGLNGSGVSVWRGADVVNISLAFSQHLVTDSALADVANRGRNGRGCPVFVAAGNSASAWEPVEFEVTEADTYTLRFEYSKDEIDIGAIGADTAWIDSIRFPDGTLETFENGLPPGWATSSFSPWRVVRDGEGGNFALTGWNGPGSRSLRAGPITHGQTNYAEFTTFLTAGKLVVWTLVSSEYQFDYFDFWLGRGGTDTLIFSQSGVPIPEPIAGYPASNPNTIAVGASTDFDYRADYSQYGSHLDFVAPSDGGVSAITTTDRTGLDGYSDTDYSTDFGGTSASSPLASGVAALALSLNRYLTAPEIRSLLRDTCEKIGDVNYIGGRNLFYGSGRLDAAYAVAQATPDLYVTLTAPVGPINVGDTTTYSITVRNIGFSRSGTITVTNPLPAGAAFVSSTPPADSLLDGLLTFTGPSLTPGSIWTINVTVTHGVAGTGTLVAGAHTDVFESSLVHNIASGALPVLPLPQISVGDATTNEGHMGRTNVAVQLTLSNPSSRKITVICQTVTNTAVTRSDFAALKTTVTFAPGETSRTVLVGVTGDTRNEADETFFVRLQSPVNAVLADDTATITILNDDALPVISAPDVVRKEGNSGVAKAVFKLRLSAASGRTVTVDYSTVPGSAQSGVDFLPTNGVVTFLPGRVTANAVVLVPGNKLLETNETFLLALSNPVNSVLATNFIACTIVNNDPPPKAYIDDAGLVEGGQGTSNVTLRVRLAAPSEIPVTLLYATTNGTALAGSDYTATNGVITFEPGETNHTVSVEVLGDLLVEDREYFSVRLSGATNAILARSVARVSITNDDVMTIQGGIVVNALPPLVIPAIHIQGRMEGDSFVLSFVGANGRSHVVEFAEQLGPNAVWKAIPGIDLPGTGALIEVPLPVDHGHRHRFYRVRAR